MANRVLALAQAVPATVSAAGLTIAGEPRHSVPGSAGSTWLAIRPLSDVICGRRLALRGGGGAVEGKGPGRRSAFGWGGESVPSARSDVRVQAAKQTFSSFDDMLQNSGMPVLVDFYAVWCGPCQMMVPILNEVGSTLKNQLRVVKIDTEKYPDLASRFNIHALPTLVLFKNGHVVDRVEGALRAGELISRVEKFL